MHYRAGDEDDRWMNRLKSAILSAISEDGLSFLPEQGIRIAPSDWIDPMAPDDISYVDGPGAVLTVDGRLKLYFWGVMICSGVCLSDSQDGLTFDRLEQVFPNERNPFQVNAGDPAILPKDDGPRLMYFGSGIGNDQGIWTARRVDR